MRTKILGIVVAVAGVLALGYGMTGCAGDGGLLDRVVTGGETVVKRAADLALIEAKCDGARAARAAAIAELAADRYPEHADAIRGAEAQLQSGLASGSSALVLVGQTQMIDAIGGAALTPAAQRVSAWKDKTPAGKIVALLPLLTATAEGSAPILAATEAANAECPAVE